MIEFKKAKWADVTPTGNLKNFTGKLEFQMHNSDATGLPLVNHNMFGADIIRFGPGEKVKKHTHPGDHILFVLKGTGIVEYYDDKYQLSPGVVYLIPEYVPHAIYADDTETNELILLAVGNDHRPVNSKDRLVMID